MEKVEREGEEERLILYREGDLPGEDVVRVRHILKPEGERYITNGQCSRFKWHRSQQAVGRPGRRI